MPWFDTWGWASETEIPGRYTGVPVPTDIPDGFAANWTGYEWVVIPYVPPNTASWMKISRLAFRSRFTMAEKVAIEMAALDNPSAPIEVRSQSAMLRAYLQDVQAAEYIDLERSDTQAGVRMLEAATLLATGRADEILLTPPTDIEAWRG